APGDVRIAVSAGTEERGHWDWVKWLPHAQDLDARDATGARRLVTDSVSDVEGLLGSEFTGRPRFEPDTPITASEPFVLIILDGVAVPADHRMTEEGYRNAVILDVSQSLPWQHRPQTLYLEVGDGQISTVSFDRL